MSLGIEACKTQCQPQFRLPEGQQTQCLPHGFPVQNCDSIDSLPAGCVVDSPSRIPSSMPVKRVKRTRGLSLTDVKTKRENAAARYLTAACKTPEPSHNHHAAPKRGWHLDEFFVSDTNNQDSGQ